MTVAVLIERLDTLDPNLPVVVEGYEDELDGIHELRVVEIVSHDGYDWDGEYCDAHSVGRGMCNHGSEHGNDRKSALFIVGRRGGRRE